MPTTDETLRRGIERRGDDLILTLDPAFQGLPDTAHGGSVLAALDGIAARTEPRAVTGTYHRRVPLGEPLRLLTAGAGAALTCRLLDGSSTLLLDGRVTPATDAPAEDRPSHPPDPARAHPLPVSRTCFACGIDNALGLRAQLAFDDTTLGGTWCPREILRRDDGSLAPVALTALLDEAAFWLGALASGESGMTTELRVTLRRPVAFGGPITVAGERGGVRQRTDDERYWDTAVVVADADGVAAAAAITFVAVRGAARRLVTGMLAMNPPETVRRVFPAYAR